LEIEYLLKENTDKIFNKKSFDEDITHRKTTDQLCKNYTNDKKND